MKLLLFRVISAISLLIFLTGNISAQCAGVNPGLTPDQTLVCGTGSTSINFTNSTTGSLGPNATFDWYQDGALFASTNNVATPVSQNVSGTGTYVFMIVVSDPDVPCTDTAYVTVVQVPAPNADFTFTPNGGCAFQDVNFTNTSTGLFSGSTFDWEFGPGPNPSTQNATTQFNGLGTYPVTLTVTNGAGCSSTSTQNVSVIDAPVASISGDDGDGDLNYCLFPGDTTSIETVIFSNFTTGAVSYDWDFGDGSPVYTTTSLADIPHTYSTYGTFTVTMTATGPNGCQTSTTLTVVFEKFVSASLTLDLTEYSGCAPHPLSTLTNLSVNASQYVWDFGDGTVITTTDPNPPAYAYTAAGTYTITLTASNSCNSATATISPIIIIDGPTANFSPSITSGCAPQTVSFSNSSQNVQPANNYQWDMGNGNTYTNTTNPPNQIYPTTGYYDIQLVAGNGCGTDTMLITIFIDTIPTVDLVLDPITGCAPLLVNPTATLLSGTNVNWQWYIDGVYTYTTPNDIPDQNFLSLNPNDSTLHTIQVNVYNACGSDSELDSVYVNPPVIAGFTAPDTICLGDIATFTNTSTGTELTYIWDFGDGSGTVNDMNTSHLYIAAGDYTVTLTTTGICGTDVATFVVSVLDIPVIDITPNPAAICAGDMVTFTNNSSTNGTYFWNFGANGSPTTSTLFDPGAVAFSGTGTQAVSFAIDYAGCVASETVLIVVSPIPIPQFTINPALGCTPLDVIITNTTVDNPGNTYDWDYGNGTNSNGYNAVNQTYTTVLSDTTYNVQLIVENSGGCSDTLVQTVLVSPLPTAIFTILDDTVCLNETMLFANNSVGATSYFWDFGDGNTSTLNSPGNTFNGTGNFLVTLIAYSTAGCTDTATTNIFVDSIPTAGFTNTIECFGNPTSFTNTSTGSPVSYDWDFGDGNTSTQIDPVNNYGAAGSYLVILTATNSVNCTNTITQLVQVNDVPIADFNWSQTCQGQAMNFTDASLNFPIGWNWDFGDGVGNSTAQNPSYAYAYTGSYTVQLVVSGGSGCLDSIDHIVYVDSIPQADFSFTEVCTNDQTVFTDNSIYNPDNYSWDFGDGGTSTQSNPAYTYTTSGTYNVTLTVTYATTGCSNSITQAVDAFPRTVPAFVANTPCLGDSTDFTDATSNSPVTWEWDFGDSSPAEYVQNPSHLYTAAGFYTITLITSNSYGCSDTLVQQIEIYGLPTAEFVYDTICQGANTAFYDNSLNDVAWEWDFGDGVGGSTIENPTYVYNNFGTYTTQLVVFNTVGCSDTVAHTITVNPNPTAGFYADTACFGYLTSLTDTSLSAVSWFYDLGDGTSSNVSDPTNIYPNDGLFTVQQVVTNIYGCQDSTTQTILIHPQPESGFTNTVVCAQDNVDFTDTTIGNVISWQWDFGDGVGTSTVQNPSYAYSVGGVYPVQLITANASGCLDTVTIDVDVHTNPTALFEADTVCFLDVTTFTDLSTDSVPIASWYYDFGDGINQSSQQNPTYIYQAPGVYPATLTVTNIYGCDSTIGINVVVNNIPVAEFTYDTVCWGSPTTFTDISNGTVNSWVWDYGDGTFDSIGPIVTHIYPAPGSYLASMEADGGNGCTDIIYHAITVIDVLTPVIGAPDTACMYEPVQFWDLSSATGTTITGWNWDFGDGNSSSSQNPVHAYAAPGIYVVTLDVQTSTGCQNTAIDTIEIFAPPTNDFTFTIPCEGQPTIFSDSSYDANGSVVYWDWDFGYNGATSNDQNPQYQYPVAGNYTVTSIVMSSNGCYDTLSQVVTIYPSPTADFIFSTECGGVPVSLIDQSIGNIVDYEWIYSGQTISTSQNTDYTFPTTTDTHPTTLVVTTDLGCIDSVTIDVITKPVVLFDYGPLTTAGCPVLEVEFFENSTTTGGGGVINWLWDMGDSTYSFAQNPIHYYEDEGTYYISLMVITAEDCIYYDTLAYGIIVYPQPTANFTYSPTVINMLDPTVEFTDLSQGASDIEWYFGDYDYSNEWNPVHEYADTGLYMVSQTVYNAYGCSDTMYQWLYVNGVLVVYLPNTFTPNGDGMNDYFGFEGGDYLSFELLIFNRWGELIKTQTDIDDPWDGVYHGEKCQDGVYTWKLRVIDLEEVPHEYVGHVSLLR